VREKLDRGYRESIEEAKNRQSPETVRGLRERVRRLPARLATGGRRLNAVFAAR